MYENEKVTTQNPTHPHPKMNTDTDTFEYAKFNDTTVHSCMERGLPLETIIVCLVKEKERYREMIMELESIAPRRIQLPCGQVAIWRCPDELIPEQ